MLNYPGEPDELNLPQNLSRIGLVDAVSVSTKAFGPRAFPITNTTMLGALAKTTGWVKLESLAEAMQEKWSGRIAESNVSAINEAYEATRVYEV